MGGIILSGRGCGGLNLFLRVRPCSCLDELGHALLALTNQIALFAKHYVILR